MLSFFFLFIINSLIKQLIILSLSNLQTNLVTLRLVSTKLLLKVVVAKPPPLFLFFWVVVAQMFKVCTKSVGFLRALKNYKIGLLFTFFPVRLNCAKRKKSKVQTPYALKNAKLVRFSTKVNESTLNYLTFLFFINKSYSFFNCCNSGDLSNIFL